MVDVLKPLKISAAEGGHLKGSDSWLWGNWFLTYYWNELLERDGTEFEGFQGWLMEEMGGSYNPFCAQKADQRLGIRGCHQNSNQKWPQVLCFRLREIHPDNCPWGFSLNSSLYGYDYASVSVPVIQIFDAWGRKGSVGLLPPDAACPVWDTAVQDLLNMCFLCNALFLFFFFNLDKTKVFS